MPGKVVVVTGASTGIGRACALRLDRLGWQVFAGVRRDQDGDDLRAEAGPRLRVLRLDVTDQAQVSRAADEVGAAAGGGLDGLVNNAGIAISAPLEFVPLERLRHQFEVNVVGQVGVTQAFLPQLRRAHGRIVLISSLGGKVSQPLVAPYTASKHALEAIGDALRLELWPWGIKVALIEPGAVRTPIWDKGAAAAEALLGKAPPQALELYGSAVAALRKVAAKEARTGVDASEVAAAVVSALTASRPRTRYPVGREARVALGLRRVLPDRAFDQLLLRLMRMPRGPAP
ncbi:MAG: SDR family NAD(P)-dependent oxidoreductase [Candidatus Dormibacteria bacterium]